MTIPLIDTLHTDELLAMKAELEEVIRQRQQADRQAVLKQIRAIAAGVGCTVEELLDKGSTAHRTARRGRRNAGVPKYRNPDNPDQTWTGKGPRPHWFIRATLNGVEPEQILIQ